MFWNASSTFEASRAEVSINDNEFSATHQYIITAGIWRLPAKALASSVGTALKCLKSDLFPTNIMTIFESA